MLNEKITGKQASSIMMLFLLGSSLVTGASLNTEQDSWLALLVALLSHALQQWLERRTEALPTNKN